MTYNTDGAQAEVDQQPNNVNRFSLFFPRKRPFFLVWVARARLEPCPTEPGRRPRHRLRLAIPLALTLLCSLLVHARANQGGVLELVATLEGRAGGVVVAGHYAYVSSGATLRIIDVSDPSQPAEVGTFTVPKRIYGFDVTAEHVYIAGGSRRPPHSRRVRPGDAQAARHPSDPGAGHVGGCARADGARGQSHVGSRGYSTSPIPPRRP